MLSAFWNSPEQLGTALRWITIVGIVLGAAFAGAAYFVTDRIGTLQSAQIAAQGDSIRVQDEVVKNQAGTIKTQNDRVQALTSDLSTVQEEAAQLAVRAQNAERGISDTYDFNGAHRQNVGGGRVVASAGAETSVFRNIMQMNEAKAWAQLRDTCENQIRNTPAWLTPYLFSGVALVNLGDLAKAKERLEYVVQHAGADPNYAEAARILEQVRAAGR
jgi:hypothetical protein